MARTLVMGDFETHVDLPKQVVVDQHGHYWRSYAGGLSMAPVSDENNETIVCAVYTLATDMFCSKCHWSMINTQWHRNRADCTYKEQRRDDWPWGAGGELEHLHYSCQNCGYTWAVATE